MRARIEDAALELGYRPSRLPGMMLSGKTGIVALVVGGFYNPFYTAMLEAFLRALKAAGKQAMLVQVESDLALDEVVGELDTYRVDGIVSALAVSSLEVAEQLARYRLPIVTLNSTVSSEWVRVVESDNRSAGQQAAQLLSQCGVQSFAYVGGAPDSRSQIERERGFLQAVVDLGHSAPVVAKGDYTYQGGWRAGLALADGEIPGGLFCANDLTAFGVIDALREKRGLVAGEDYRIIGYDNVDAAGWQGYGLTSFDQEVDTLAHLAIGLLDTSEITADPIKVMPSLQRRKSC